MTRRNFFSHLAALASGRTAGTEITPRMAALIGEFKAAEAALMATDEDIDPTGWQIVADMETQALRRLLNRRPASMAEFCAKFEAVIVATSTDTENHILRILLADARDLAGRGK